MRHTEIDRKPSQCAPALRRTSRTTTLDPKSAIVAPKMPNLPPKMAFVAPKMALWALLGASRRLPEASPERPWAPQGHQDRFLAVILVGWDASTSFLACVLDGFGDLRSSLQVVWRDLRCNHARAPTPALHQSKCP